jgi:hypothetical protein
MNDDGRNNVRDIAWFRAGVTLDDGAGAEGFQDAYGVELPRADASLAYVQNWVAGRLSQLIVDLDSLEEQGIGLVIVVSSPTGDVSRCSTLKREGAVLEVLSKAYNQVGDQESSP